MNMKITSAPLFCLVLQSGFYQSKQKCAHGAHRRPPASMPLTSKPRVSRKNCPQIRTHNDRNVATFLRQLSATFTMWFHSTPIAQTFSPRLSPIHF